MFVQEPQWEESVFRFTQLPPQQLDAEEPQAFPQAPQFAVSVVVSTQDPPQLVRPRIIHSLVSGPTLWRPDMVPIGAVAVVVATAAVVVTGAVVPVTAVLVQVEAIHESPVGHAFPHWPQLAGLEVRS